MSDHDPNGDDDFLNRPYGFNDPSPIKPFPMPSQTKTMSYSFVEGKDGSKESSVAKTVEMEAMHEDTIKDSKHVANIEKATVLRVVTELIEQSGDAWKCLPQGVRNLLLSVPWEFTLVPNPVTNIPSIIYGGVEFRYSSIANNWVLDSIRK